MRWCQAAQTFKPSRITVLHTCTPHSHTRKHVLNLWHLQCVSGLQVRSDRQTMMFSATWPTGVQQLAVYFMTEPVKVVIGSQDLAASHSITQVSRSGCLCVCVCVLHHATLLAEL